MRHTARLLIFIASLWSCAPNDEASHDEPSETHASLSVAKAPALEHGQLWFGARVESDFGSHALQAWTFELSQPANVRLETEASATGPELDTVLYLYRQTEAGWGPYLARNDDRTGSGFSSIERSLGAGRYRVVVKGPKARANGFVLVTSCEGTGCHVPKQPAECALGRELADLPGLLSLSTIVTMQGRIGAVDKMLPQQLVATAQQAPLRGVASAAQLFAVVDSGLVRWFRVWDQAAARDFRAVEFRLKGRSYGAIFPPAAAEPVALVQSGKLRECSVPVVRCALGTTFHELRDNPAFALQSKRVIAAANVATLDAEEQAQLLVAVQVAYEDAVDVPAALAAVDQGEINQLRFTSGIGELAVYEYGAGDNSYGGVFKRGSSELVARINDGDLIDCTLLE